MSMSETKLWLQRQLQVALDFERPEDTAELAAYTLSLAPNSIAEHLEGLLGASPATKQLSNELLKRLGYRNDSKAAETSHARQNAEGMSAYTRTKEDSQTQQFNTSATKKRIAQTGTEPAIYRKDITLVVKKKKKGAKSGAERTRVLCNCQARIHDLVNNCIRCGRIVCVQEGPGECMFCGHLVVPYGEQPPPVDPSEIESDRMIRGRMQAQNHLEKLLEYDQNAVRRTTVYDDESDYFDMSKWLSPEERKFLKEKEEQLAKAREERKNKFTIDLKGRKVVAVDESVTDVEESIRQEIREVMARRPTEQDRAFFNPTLEGPRPQFVSAKSETQPPLPGSYAAVATKHTSEQANKEEATGKGSEKKPVMKKNERVQHQYFPDIDLVSDDVEEEREVPIETKAAKAATPPVSYTYVSSANSAKTAEVKTAVPGLRYIREFLTPTEEKKLIYLIDSMKWDTTLSRRTQQYGYIYDYSAVNTQERGESRLRNGPPFPDWLKALAEKVFKANYAPQMPDQCIINEYLPGQGIKPHVDHLSSFDDCVVSITLNAGAIMEFKNFKTKEVKSVFLEPRSLIAMQGESRRLWSHGIDARDVDEVDGVTIKRGRRVSITFRKVLAQSRIYPTHQNMDDS